ncbi:hypothetical protein AURDEDRAFT_175576 [Auricularia subglabra TFB-10046 SS5]|uniref:F-box domain-containing protein n=1 Tax=Auricularia subglabra (strain TFB-10046 / SS5) TaxID=717982 RepID=J0WRM3_AURST|nr:hypothetical protein AURDEDRAFT_175576 [Auricularia subglabra TFB-10046 SS5]
MATKAICDIVPDELLLCALDYLSLADLLVLMRISKRWFALAVEHPIYWQKLVLRARSSHAHYAHGLALIRKRLSRSNGRPVQLVLDLQEPQSAVTELLEDISRHLYHIETLEITGSVDFAETLFDSLHAPAPYLQSFKLVLRPATIGFPYPVVTLRRDIFDSHAPVLTHASFSNLCLPAAAAPGLGAIEELELGCTWLWECMVTRELFPLAPRLRALTLTGDVIVDRPKEGWDVDCWENLEALVFNGTPISHSWHTLNLPITNVRDVAVLHGDAISVAVLSDQLHGPLRATIAFVPESGELDMTFYAASPRDGRAHIRRVSAPVTEDADDAVLRELSALANRITSLKIPLYTRDRTAEALAMMPHLTELELSIVAKGNLSDACEVGPAISCPSLARLALTSASRTLTVAISLEDVFQFTSACTKDVAYPLSLTLDGVVLRGGTETMPDIFEPVHLCS